MKLRYKQPFFNWLAQLFQKVSGVPPLAMPRAVAGGLKEVTAYGGCALNSIPSEYTEVTYVSNASNTLVKTGVVIGNDDTFKMDIKASVVQGPFYLFQSRDRFTGGGATSSTITGISGSSTEQTITGAPGVAGYSLVSAITRPLSAVSNILRIIFTCTDGNASLYVKDLDTGEEDTVGEPYDASQLTRGSTEMCLYGNNAAVGDATPNRLAKSCRIYYAKLWKNGLLVLDLVPVKRNADNAAGFYNRVNGTFLTASEGSLTAGDAVTPSPDSPCEIWCNNGTLKVLGHSTWTIITNPESLPAGGVFISSTGLWMTMGDRGAGVVIPITVGKVYTLTINHKNITIGTILRYGQSPQATPTAAGIQLVDWYRGSMVDGTAISFIAKEPYFVMQLSANAMEPGMADEALELLEAQGPAELINILNYEQTVLNSAIVNNLLATEGTTKDSQDILRGNIVHKCGILVLNGKESWQNPSTQGIGRFVLSNSLYPRYPMLTLCTHFKYANEASATGQFITVGYIAGTVRRIVIGDRINYTESGMVTQFKNWLADQYAVGNPVIIVYPKDSEVSNTVAPQDLDTVAGTNTLEITQASLPGLELTAEYKRH